MHTKSEYSEWRRSKKARSSFPDQVTLRDRREEKEAVTQFLESTISAYYYDEQSRRAKWLSDVATYRKCAAKGPWPSFKVRARRLLNALHNDRFSGSRKPRSGEQFVVEPNTMFVHHDADWGELTNFERACSSGVKFRYRYACGFAERNHYSHILYDLRRRRAHGYWTSFWNFSGQYVGSNVGYFYFENLADAVYLRLMHSDSIASIEVVDSPQDD